MDPSTFQSSHDRLQSLSHVASKIRKMTLQEEVRSSVTDPIQMPKTPYIK